MKKLEFKMENGRSILEFDGSVVDAAKAVATLAHAVYSAYVKEDPDLAMAFQELTTIYLVDEASLVWTAHELEDGDVEETEISYEEEHHGSES